MSKLDPDLYTALCIDGPLQNQMVSVRHKTKDVPPTFDIPAVVDFMLFVADPNAGISIITYHWIDHYFERGIEMKVWASLCQTCKGSGEIVPCYGQAFCNCPIGVELNPCPECRPARWERVE